MLLGSIHNKLQGLSATSPETLGLVRTSFQPDLSIIHEEEDEIGPESLAGQQQQQQQHSPEPASPNHEGLQEQLQQVVEDEIHPNVSMRQQKRRRSRVVTGVDDDPSDPSPLLDSHPPLAKRAITTPTATRPPPQPTLALAPAPAI